LIFLNAIIVVIVGCMAVLHVRQMMRFFDLYKKFKGVDADPDARQAFMEFLSFARAYYEFAPSLEERVKSYQDPFLRETVTAFLHGGIVGSDLLRTLRQRAEQKFETEVSLMHELQLVVRGLPVVGWALAIAATIWMFNTPEAVSFQRVGLAFSVCMAGAAYGILLTYMVMMPLMEKIWRTAHENKAKNSALVDGLSHLMRKKNVFELYETIQVLLPEENRPKWAEVFPDKMKLVG